MSALLEVEDVSRVYRSGSLFGARRVTAVDGAMTENRGEHSAEPCPQPPFKP